MYKKDNTILIKLPDLVWTLKIKFKKKGKANKYSFIGFKEVKRAIKYKKQVKQQIF